MEDWNTDCNIVQWIRKIADNSMDTQIIYRFPTKKQTTAKTKGFAVKEHERAILLKNGELISEMESGTYELDKQARKPGTEIVWIATNLFSIPWGIPQINGVYTKDGFQIGMFGDLKLNIEKPLYFYKYVVGGSPFWTLRQLKEWIKSLLHSCLRDILKKYELLQIFQENHQVLREMLIGKVIEEFDSYGINLSSFNILGFKTPDSASNLLDSKKTTAILHEQVLQKEKYQSYEEIDRILNRISSLKQRQRGLQDDLMDNKITNDEFREKKNILTIFLEESNRDLYLLKHPNSLKKRIQKRTQNQIQHTQKTTATNADPKKKQKDQNERSW